jgi:hypothetical protein
VLEDFVGGAENPREEYFYKEITRHKILEPIIVNEVGTPVRRPLF